MCNYYYYITYYHKQYKNKNYKFKQNLKKKKNGKINILFCFNRWMFEWDVWWIKCWQFFRLIFHRLRFPSSKYQQKQIHHEHEAELVCDSLERTQALEFQFHEYNNYLYGQETQPVLFVVFWNWNQIWKKDPNNIQNHSTLQIIDQSFTECLPIRVAVVDSSWWNFWAFS